MLPMHLLLFSQGLEEEGEASRGRFWWSLASLIILVVGAGLVLRTIFFVDETEYVYVTQFGQPLRLYTAAGLGVKWPYQSLWRFDRRLQMYAPPAREMLTEDKENLNFQWYVCWQIPGAGFLEQPARLRGQFAPGDRAAAAGDNQDRHSVERYVRRFLQSVGTIENAESRLEERIQAAIAAEVGQARLQQLISLDAAQLQLEEMTRRILKDVRQVAAEQFGMEVVDIRLKRFNYPASVKESVYAAIRSERETKAVEYRAEGASQKAKIESLADLHRDKLLSLAQRDATTVRGQGEAKAIEIFNAAHSKNPEFYQLLKTLETYRSILDDQTTVVLSADSPLLKLLTRGLPGLTSEGQDLPSDQPPSAIAPTTGAALPGDSGTAGLAVRPQSRPQHAPPPPEVVTDR